MNKLLFIFVIIIIVLGGLYLGFGSNYFQKPQLQKYTGPVEKINFSSSLDVKNAAIYIATQKGYFQEEGLSVTINEIPSAKQAFINMLNGEGVDIATVAEVPIVFSSFEKKDFYIFASLGYSYDDKIIARKDKGISTVADLKGKKVGVSGKGTSTHFFLSTLLTFNGLAQTDLEIIFMEPNLLQPALVNGTLDAVVFWEPNASKTKELLQNKAATFLNQKIYRKTFNLTVRKDFAQNHPDTIVRFLKAIDKANKFIEGNKEESQTLVAERLKLDKKELTAIWDENSKTLSLDQSLLLTMEDEARWAIANKLTDKTVVPNYLNYIYFDALEKVKPEAVTIIR